MNFCQTLGQNSNLNISKNSLKYQLQNPRENQKSHCSLGLLFFFIPSPQLPFTLSSTHTSLSHRAGWPMAFPHWPSPPSSSSSSRQPHTRKQTVRQNVSPNVARHSHRVCAVLCRSSPSHAPCLTPGPRHAKPTLSQGRAAPKPCRAKPWIPAKSDHVPRSGFPPGDMVPHHPTSPFVPSRRPVLNSRGRASPHSSHHRFVIHLLLGNRLRISLSLSLSFASRCHRRMTPLASPCSEDAIELIPTVAAIGRTSPMSRH